ncbi:MAG: hypothetical protein DGJ47_000295 [Rickettsiaceae bacterium]
MKKIIYCLIIISSVVANHYVHAQEYIEPYNHLLSHYVSEGEKDNIRTTLIDYDAWGEDPLHHQAIKKLQGVSISNLQGAKKMAFWINAYNLLTIDLIVKTGETDSIKNQGSFWKNVWKSHSWMIDGTNYTLDQIEHKILRPMADPRIHMAINCASLSCPDLLNEAYQAEKLDWQLTNQVKNFLGNDSKGVKLVSDYIYVSKIFDWFKEDFGGYEGIRAFVNQYKNIDVDHLSIRYMKYNWDLNGVDISE